MLLECTQMQFAKADPKLCFCHSQGSKEMSCSLNPGDAIRVSCNAWATSMFSYNGLLIIAIAVPMFSMSRIGISGTVTGINPQPLYLLTIWSSVLHTFSLLCVPLVGPLEDLQLICFLHITVLRSAVRSSKITCILSYSLIFTAPFQINFLIHLWVGLVPGLTERSLPSLKRALGFG